ncbi:PREDICTED: immune-associated nucleotide-binding protein 8-like [Nelumbo nucifera]|uniref:AIG1-type G domain-containing protein n=2 Tax=Nelumbo nucifera TaxID=4432 RepID=A0A822XR82_NELNU|nr:PREDICTED: immune-associated nucleotide-binding protein 8-like [Nelumbo nucifera]DAD22532.1 TPA_asm: hypothetical protein HUJ06_023995 [Nelumbo nucifera]
MMGSSTNEITMVIVGRTGNGKSATGNSILGRNAFKARRSSGSITRHTEMQTTLLQDGKRLNVIDTPGLFDFTLGPDIVSKEIVKCIDLAKDGIHAVLMVYSIQTRFSVEEKVAFQTIQDLFDQNIVNYMIVVFTGGDMLEKDEETLQDYLIGCPKPLQEIMGLCKNRVVVFDNKSKDENKRNKQMQNLLFVVNNVIKQNNGRPYTNEHFVKLQEETKMQNQQLKEAEQKGIAKEVMSKMQAQLRKAYDNQLGQIMDMVNSNLEDSISRIKKQLEEQRAALAEEIKAARMVRGKSEAEITRLVQELAAAKTEIEQFDKKMNSRCGFRLKYGPLEIKIKF